MPLDCKEQTIENSEFCIFHDKSYYVEHEQEAARRFEEKVRRSINQNEPLVCLGCYLPGINFANLFDGKNFAQPVYFNTAKFSKEADFYNATFIGLANFFNTTFSKGAYFGGATFFKGANFTDGTFTEEANFLSATFKGANFFNTTFSKGANFEGATFTEEVYFMDATFTEVANFMGATFTEDVNFLSATFSKEAYFGRTTFSKEAHFFNTTFSKEANFEDATFSKANFEGATFSKEAYFGRATFSKEAYFGRATFLSKGYFIQTNFIGETFFRYTIFEQPNKVTFNERALSKVSFADSDITRIRFGDNITWGGADKFTIVEEKWLREKAGGQTKTDIENVTLELVLSVYRNLRENYEFRLRYDDAGKFFIKEMELKRKYREIRTEKGTETRKNGWFRRNFSLTGLYYHFSRYGESISRPTLIGAITVFLSTLFWVTQSNPSLEPHIPFFFFSDNSTSTAAAGINSTTSTFVGFDKAGEPSQWREAFERSFADFLPLLPAGDFKVGIIDFIIKIVGGALTFGLLLIAFRRKFERKYTR